jgi:hypothetical protein
MPEIKQLSDSMLAAGATVLGRLVVSPIAAAMCEQFAKDVGASADGVHAELCTDATLLPPPPFESYEDDVWVGTDVAPRIAVEVLIARGEVVVDDTYAVKISELNPSGG